MRYDPRKGDHDLPHDPFAALVVPRPIAWITTLGRNGVVNLAPYSFFNAVATRPPMVMFASGHRKHSQTNAEETGEFVVNLVPHELREEMNRSSEHVGPEVSEAELTGLDLTPSVTVRPPRVARSPAALECLYVKSIALSGADGTPRPGAIILGEVVSIYIDDDVIADGRVDVLKIKPVSRLGYMDYTTVESIFSMIRPD